MLTAENLRVAIGRLSRFSGTAERFFDELPQWYALPAYIAVVMLILIFAALTVVPGSDATEKYLGLDTSDPYAAFQKAERGK